MQSSLKQVVFTEPTFRGNILTSPPNPSVFKTFQHPPNNNEKFVNVYKLLSPSSSPPITDAEDYNNGPIVNIPNNSIKFLSLKEFEQKNPSLLTNNSNSNLNGSNSNINMNQSLFSQINGNIMGYKSDKIGQMELEISGLLKVRKEKQKEINSLKADLKALTIALKEKDILQNDAKFLENSLNSILCENKRLNDMMKVKLEEFDAYKNKYDEMIKENTSIKRTNEALYPEIQNLKKQNILDKNNSIDIHSFTLLKEIELLKKNNFDLQLDLQIQQQQIQNSLIKNSQTNENTLLKKEIEQIMAKNEYLMNENIRINELNNEKSSLNDNFVQLVEKSEELIKENERLNILIKEQTFENNSWRNKLYDSDQKFIKSIDENNDKIQSLTKENEDIRQRNQKLLQEINELVSLFKEKDKINEENQNLRKNLEKKDQIIEEFRRESLLKDTKEIDEKELSKKIETLILENIRLNSYIEEKLKDYNALDDLNSKIEVLIAENTKLNSLVFEGQHQIEYWKTRFFTVNPIK